MRNLIKYYYKLEPLEIHQKKDFYTFNVENKNYKLFEANIEDIERAYKLALEFYSNGLYSNHPLKTTMNTWQVAYNQKLYHLVEYDKSMEELININKIVYFQKSIEHYQFNNLLNTSNWGLLWSKKMDYFEYQMNQFGIKYPIIRETFAYYIGLAEMGIALFNTYYNENYPLIVSHKRIRKKSDLYDIYDPFNMVKDLKVRDISEYFKSMYLEKDVYKDIIDYLNNEALSKYEKIMFYIRMFYPSFYFDVFEKITDGNLNEKDLEKIIKKTENYDTLLKKIYNHLSNEIEMPIMWVN